MQWQMTKAKVALKPKKAAVTKKAAAPKEK
jgi:hypothetical protein